MFTVLLMRDIIKMKITRIFLLVILALGSVSGCSSPEGKAA
jgi:hypothetical protein